MVQKMPWSSRPQAEEKSNILKKANESSLAADISILNYVPKQIEYGTPEAAVDYLREKEKGSDFVMNNVLRQTTGVDAIEKLSEETKIENKVLEKLTLIQAEAYQKAFDLGLEEGLKKALTEKTNDINHNLDELEKLMLKLINLKEEMAKQNESHLIQLVYEIARRIAFDHIEENPEVVISVIKNAIEIAQANEDITVLVSGTQVDFLEKMKLQTGREFEFLKKIKFQVSDQVTSGSCIIETNFGVVDARIEERVNKLWTELKQALPRVKSPIS